MLVLLYITLGLLGLYLFLRLEKEKGKPLPGPKGWPFFGLAFELTEDNFFLKLLEYAQQYGDVFRIKIFGRTMIVLGSVELIRKAFTADPYKKVMNDRPKTFYGENILFGGQTMGFMKHAFGSKHSDLRKGFTRAMHVYGEGRKEFEDLVQSELSRMIETIESYGSQEFDFQDHIKHSLENIISLILSGHDLQTEENFKVIWEYDRAVDFFLNQKVDVMLKVFPFMKRIPSLYRDRFNEIINAKNALAKMFYHDAKATYKSGVIRGYVDFMIEEQLQSLKNEEDVLFTDEIIICQILEALSAVVWLNFHNQTKRICLGHIFTDDNPRGLRIKMPRMTPDCVIRGILIRDHTGVSSVYVAKAYTNTWYGTISRVSVLTTLSNLGSMFLILMNHPEYQQKIQKEIDQVIGKDRLPTLADKPHCPMIEAVVLETNRYIPVVPGLLPHFCKPNIEFEGYDIPKNSTIIPNLFHVHHDENIWGDPWNFRPERFLDENGDILPNDHPLRKSLLSFGIGRRQCIGESLARSRVFLFTATLLQRCTFELPQGRNLPCDPRFGDFDWNVVLRPKPYFCRAVSRGSTKRNLSNEA